MNGKECSNIIREQIKTDVERFSQMPKLVVFQVGNDEASNTYIRNKQKACMQVGIAFELKKYEHITQDALIEEIHRCNSDANVSAILVQLPLPKDLQEKIITNEIVPFKDVDGLTNLNQGLLWNGQEAIVPCTPKGIVKLLKMNHIDISSKNVIVIGRSNLVGKPLAALLLQEDATVTVCHSKTKNLFQYTRQADIIIVAVGKANLLTGDMVKEGAVVIDVGMNYVAGKICGDCDYVSLVSKCQYISPVPGGVGPMTITSLLENVLECHKKSR